MGARTGTLCLCLAFCLSRGIKMSTVYASCCFTANIYWSIVFKKAFLNKLQHYYIVAVCSVSHEKPFSSFRALFVQLHNTDGNLLCWQGDSGGPLACKDQQDTWTAIGINSFGFSYCAQSVVTRVSTYVNWIQQIIGHYP